MPYELGSELTIGDKNFTVIKDTRLMGGAVIASGGVYGRIGPKHTVLEERDHTTDLHTRGFPVPEVLDSGELSDGSWYFTESSVGKLPFHKIFMAEYRQQGRLSDESFDAYLRLVKNYLRAQTASHNRIDIDAETFISTVIPHDRVLPSYEYFGKDSSDYLKALQKATQKLNGAATGILQFDLNPYNMLEDGVIDFELVGLGPIGYDTLLSPRWSSTWFTRYPSRYPVGYAPSDEQIAQNDALVATITAEQGLPDPQKYLQEFLLIKSAWAVSDHTPPLPDWPADKTAFRAFRVNVLQAVVNTYLRGEEIDTKSLPHIPGGEVEA